VRLRTQQIPTEIIQHHVANDMPGRGQKLDKQQHVLQHSHHLTHRHSNSYAPVNMYQRVPNTASTSRGPIPHHTTPISPSATAHKLPMGATTITGHKETTSRLPNHTAKHTQTNRHRTDPHTHHTQQHRITRATKPLTPTNNHRQPRRRRDHIKIR
jgi:hypothetical protein